jgi:hypothetical protein
MATPRDVTDWLMHMHDDAHRPPESAWPYRAEWRNDLTTGFLLLKACETYEEAVDQCEDARRQSRGQTRVIAQHVVQVDGLGWPQSQEKPQPRRTPVMRKRKRRHAQ